MFTAKRVAGLITTAWVISVAIFAYFSEAAVVGLKLNELGDFLAGVFAPIAFVWLVVAVWIQSAELKEQRTELQLTREEFKHQRDVMLAQALEAKRQAEFIGVQTKILEAEEGRRKLEEADNLFRSEVNRLASLIRRDSTWNFSHGGDHIILVNAPDLADDFEFMANVANQLSNQYRSNGVEKLNTPIVGNNVERLRRAMAMLKICVGLESTISLATHARASSMRLKYIMDISEELLGRAGIDIIEDFLTTKRPSTSA